MRGKPEKSANKAFRFTDIALDRLNAEKHLKEVNEKRRKEGLKPLIQFRVWDKDPANRGLSLLVGARSKTFQSTFKFNGKWHTASIGTFGQMTKERSDIDNIQIGEARKKNIAYRALARDGKDPREPETNPLVERRETFEYVLDRFINEYAKPRQRTWDQTERILKKNCADFLKRPIDKITKKEIDELLSGFIADGHGYKAGITRAWLKKMWRWAYSKDLVSTPIMEGVTIEYERRSRDRVYSDTDIKALWDCADGKVKIIRHNPKAKSAKPAKPPVKLTPREAAYLKLMVLLAPRKSELVGMRWSEIAPRKFKLRADDNSEIVQTIDVWITPPERVKQSKRREQTEKRVYQRPLSPLALDILRKLRQQLQKAGDEGDEIFKGVSTGRPMLRKLTKLGAPDIFKEHSDYHAWRHTVATWLQDQGYSKDECGLILQHAATGGATPGYMHGFAIKLTQRMLNEWADHVAKITGTPKPNVPAEISQIR